MEFKTENGDFNFELASNFICDITDGYIRQVKRVKESDNYSKQDIKEMCDNVDDVSEKELKKLIKNDMGTYGKRLLNSLSAIHSIILDYKFHEQDEKIAIQRLDNFAEVTSVLSDMYASKDTLYKRNIHTDVLELCNNISEFGEKY